MKKYSLIQWFKNISIARKLYFAMGVMALLIAMELITLFFSVKTLSSVRAFVGGEGLWSKAQKDAIYNLRKYVRSGKEEDYSEFLYYMKVPLGDRITRMEMGKPNPDINILRQGFIAGHNHPDDVDGMINLFLRFHNISYIDKAIKIWAKADSTISKMEMTANKVHSIISVYGISSSEKLDASLDEINEINKKLSALEDDFSYTLGEGSRWLENFILKILLIIAITVEVTGLLITISIGRNISKGINEIIRVSEEVVKGNFETKAIIYSKDEIGKLATSFNEMIFSLAQNIREREIAELQIIHKSEELALSNKELEQFAYISSHDLQEPLRTVVNYVGLLQKKHKGKLDKDTDEYLDYITDATERMQLLIKGLLEYSRIGNDKIATEIDCNILLADVLHDMKVSIEESNCIINLQTLPVIKGYSELKSVFQNLISNAIKFRKKDRQLNISISVKDVDKDWLFAIKDNGIGIEKKYYDRIFIIFQRLHSIKEYEGTGIGLAQSKKIIELHGGKIWVESDVEAGSTFYFTIPKTK